MMEIAAVSANRDQSIEDLQDWSLQLFGHRFAKPNLLIEAVTHSSAARRSEGNKGGRRSNERLEFLGDRVIGLAVSHLLIELFPNEAEGALTHRLGALVRRETLAEIARNLSLGEKLQLGVGQAAAQDGRINPAILADFCEAVLGAIYMDAGYDTAHAVIERYWRPLAENMPSPPRDSKTALQEWAQARGHALPRYEVLEREGPAHAPTFKVHVGIETGASARGSGTSKRTAEQEAAERLLRHLAG